jgi:TonB-dependent SusC/RagA subfamily outer membrane receptor
MPTAEDVKKMDVTALEKNAQAVGVSGLEKANYFINGKPATSDEVHALGPEKIASIRVMKRATVKDGVPQDAGGLAEVRIVTKDAPEGTDGFAYAGKGAPGGVREQEIVVRKIKDAQAGGDASANTTFRYKSRDGGPQPLIVIDGVPADQAAMAKLDPHAIQSIDVLKDEAATKVYGSRGVGGVILITTKK